MILEITKILPYKKSNSEGVYTMLQMKEIKIGRFYFTYCCPMYRNFRRWQKIARVGNEIWFRTLKMKNWLNSPPNAYLKKVGGKIK